MKTPVQLIQHYTCKVAQYSAIHPAKHRNPYRYNRLMLYKTLMHERLSK